MDAARLEMRGILARVARWGCQYQSIDVQSIAASSLDLIVIDPIIDATTGRGPSAEELQRLKHKPNGERRLVLAYLSVGAAEEYRPYWSPHWRAGFRPDWLGPESPDWPGSHAVRYWHPAWQEIVRGAIIRLVEAGFDGVFLDRVDAYSDWRHLNPGGQAEMVDFVAGLAEIARSRNPGFLLVGQNAEHLLSFPRYLDAIDAVSKESLLTGLKGHEIANSADDVKWSLSYLRLAKSAGLTILSIEYLDDAALIETVAARHLGLGFVPFFARRLLDRLP